ncbi:hypothetical protein GCM10018955_73850 [Planomonospora venezuelensis]
MYGGVTPESSGGGPPRALPRSSKIIRAGAGPRRRNPSLPLLSTVPPGDRWGPDGVDRFVLMICNKCRQVKAKIW